MEESRFWRLIDGSDAAMFGVFNGYEKQLLRDWITQDCPASRPRPYVRREAAVEETFDDDADLLNLEAALADKPAAEQMSLLMPWLQPQRHWRPAGLFATRRFMQLRARLR